VVAAQTTNAGPWALMNDLPAQVEPRLNAWLARLLGDPARYRFQARVLQQVDREQVRRPARDALGRHRQHARSRPR
jgi:hypothetical protein